ncbi:MAG: sugar ABC transporter ATP-binding protein, partial [Limnochordales bacterium]
FEVDIDPDVLVGALSTGRQQMIEILKALSQDPKVLILDEPTASLTQSEADHLFRHLNRLKERGIAIIFISHHLQEVFQLADRVTVLRDGRPVVTRPTRELTQEQMASLMVGRDLEDMYPPKQPVEGTEVVLAVEGIHVPGWVRGASFALHRGEILGFAGLVGAGRTELMEGILGLRPRTAGQVYRNGKPLALRSLREARQAGIVYLTEDRKGKGLLLDKPLRPNLTLLSLERYCRPFIDQRREAAALVQAVDEFAIRVPHLETTVNTLSGGNQQKLALAKIMQVEPEIIILDEPTRGIDVGTKREIYYFIHQLAAQGRAVILISSELQEIIGLSHRVVVMRFGEITGVLTGADINEEEIMRYATGVKGAGRHAAGA